MSVTPNLSLPKPTLDPSDVWGQDWHDAMDVIDATMDGAAGHSHDGTDGEGPKLTQAHSHESSDTDSAPTAIHHTLGTGANQAAVGNHTHSASDLSTTFIPLTNGDATAPALIWDSWGQIVMAEVIG